MIRDKKRLISIAVAFSIASIIFTIAYSAQDGSFNPWPIIVGPAVYIVLFIGGSYLFKNKP